MALSDDILTVLLDYSGGYRLMRQQLLHPTHPHTRRNAKINPKTLYVTMARLQQRGLAGKKKNAWAITGKGKWFLKKRLSHILPSHSRSPRTQKQREKNMIIVFDIPEIYRGKRAWLRAELTALGFSPIQKSVWLGPAPLPREFLRNLDTLNIIQYLKFFEAKETDII